MFLEKLAKKYIETTAAIKITVKPEESRERDIKRKRVLLSIGDKNWHLSQEEVKKLIKDLTKAMI